MNRLADYSSRFRILKGGKISLVVSALLAGSTMSFAAPSGGNVTSGSATINQSGSITTINQSTQKASINWQNFSIGSNETVNFVQPNVSSITLNRVIGNEKSIINGALNANGQVWILNSNGVLFNSTARINTSGLVATTAQLSDADFQNGNYAFKNATSNSVINLGTIEVSNAGSLVLASNEVNNGGTIKALSGRVHLVGADSYTLNLNGNSLVNLTVNKGVLDALVKNSGTILADGGEIYLTTNAVNELLKGVVNNTGLIEANSLEGITGKVELYAHGGEVQVGGAILAKEGFVETSGKDFSIDKDTVIKAKTWLIDPTNLTISNATAYETALGNGTDTLIQTNNATGSDEGNIYINDIIDWTTTAKLTLDAYNNIYINSAITATSGGKLALYYGQGAAASGNTADYFINAKVNLSSGDNFFTKQGNDGTLTTWKVITDLGSEGSTTGTDLQGMNGNLAGNYVLGADIDASATSGWNSGTGWTPIGRSGGFAFTGKFDGLGHTVSHLYIYRPENSFSNNNMGLFGFLSGSTLSNIGVINANITANGNVGALAGCIQGASLIKNSYSSGSISGTDIDVGGLVGFIWNSAVDDSYSTANVSGTLEVGGLVGGSYGSSSITNSYATGHVIGTGDYIGGLVGMSYAPATITTSYATGDVEGANYVGGLAGSSGNSISNSYATGDVTGTSNVGGLLGINLYASVDYAYSTGRVTGTSNVGGLIGANVEPETIVAYYDKTVNIGMADESSYGKTTDELNTLATFSGWDIQTDSTIDKGTPFLAWQRNGNTYTKIWVIGTKVPGSNSGGSNSGGSSSGGSTTSSSSNDVANIITPIVNNIIVPQPPKFDFKPMVSAPQAQPIVMADTGNPVSVMSQPTLNQNTTMVTMGELKANQDTDTPNASGDIRVPIGDNSVIELINGGVNLPEGVEQQFFIVADKS